MTQDDDNFASDEVVYDQEFVDMLRARHAYLGEMIEEIARQVDKRDKAVDIKPVPAVSETPIHDLNLNTHAFNLLMRYDIRTVEKLVTYSDDELLQYKGIGDETVKNIIESLAAYGESLKQPYTGEHQEE